MAINTIKYIEEFLKIRSKDGKLLDFKFNTPQLKLYEAIRKQWEEKKPIRIIILKARQMGFSTATGGIMFQRTATQKLIQTAIITHRDSTTQELFEMYKRYYQNLPEELKPSVIASNAKELIFNDKQGKGLDSKIKCMTASDEGVGRGGTTQYIHMSEYAFWKNAHEVYVSVMQCVPNTPNSMVIIESTANGYNDFKTLWDNAVAGENDFVPLFFPWYEMKEYRRPYNGFVMNQEEIELMKRFNLDKEQISWRRWAIKNNCGGDLDKFKQEYPATPEEAFLFTGNSFFDMEALKQAKEAYKPPKLVGHFEFTEDMSFKPIDESIRFVEGNEKDIVKIYFEANDLVPYVISGDTAGEGSDNFIGQVIDNVSGEQVAKLKYEGADELYYTQQMYCLGKMFNDALMAVEVNFSTYPQKKLEEWHYPSFYVRETYDNYTNKPKASFGFKTDVMSRPNILANLQSVVKNYWFKIHDYETLNELETFVKNEKGKPEAMEGAHDDHVMALAIAYHARQQQSFNPFPSRVVETKKILPYELTIPDKDNDVVSDEEYDEYSYLSEGEYICW